MHCADMRWRSPEHHLRLFPTATTPSGLIIHRHHRRLIDDDAATTHVHERVFAVYPDQYRYRLRILEREKCF